MSTLTFSMSDNTFFMAAWVMSGEHLSPIGSLKYLYLPNGVTMVQRSWLSLSSSNVYYCILTSSFVKNLYPECLRKMSVIIGKGYCMHLITLFDWRKSLIQHTLASFLGMMNEEDAHSLSCCAARTPILTRWSSSLLKVFKWILGTGYGLECIGLAFWINNNVYLFVWINSKSSVEHHIVFL